MDRDSNMHLFENLDRAIDIAFKNIASGAIYSDFVLEATELDPRLYAASSIPDPLIRELWEYADEYFDVLSRGATQFRGMGLDQAGDGLESRRQDLRRFYSDSLGL